MESPVKELVCCMYSNKADTSIDATRSKGFWQRSEYSVVVRVP